MNLVLINLTVSVVLVSVNGQSELINILGFRLPRRLVWILSGNKNEILKGNQKVGKTQIYQRRASEFYCDAKNGPGRRSKTPPTSVDQLRPGDIDIIAAMGDSLSAGNGGISEYVFQVLNEHRGISFSGGGRANWRKYLTLPNILKEFNRKLYGYSVNDGLAVDYVSRLNIAEPMLMSKDMVYHARVLIQRMRADSNVNMRSHWKLLTIFVGNNDFCSDSCHHKSYKRWIDLHEKNLVKTLRLLRDNVPRLFINLVSIPNLTKLYHMRHSSIGCYAIHRIACSCLFNPWNTEKDLKVMSNAIKLWQEREIEIVERNEFHRNDFTVVIQPIFTNFTLPLKMNGEQDFRFFASDCFHFSQLGHALSAKGLWNNMLQPLGFKNNDPLRNPLQFICPTDQNPHLATRKNSQKLWFLNSTQMGNLKIAKIMPPD